jgi:glycosyltransferase involved in cell wall biosynthesis
VVLANYNGAEFLEHAIESVLVQQGAPFELILIDDGSTDGSLNVMRETARLHPETVAVIDHGRNRGQGAGFNSGIQAARGTLVSFIDSDDVWYPDKLKQVEEAFALNPGAVLHHHNMDILREGTTTGAQVVDMMAMGDIAARWRRTKCHPQFLPRFAPTTALSLPLAVLRKIGPCPEVRVCADMWLTFAPLGFGPVSASLVSKAAYRVHDSNNYFGGSMDIWDLLFSQLAPPMQAMFQRTGVTPYLPDPGSFPVERGVPTMTDRLLDLSFRKVLARFNGRSKH